MTNFEKSSINKRLNKVYPTYNKEVKIAIIGNAPDEDSARIGIPFKGEVGTILDELLEIVGIDRAECYIGNIFLERPPMNQLSYFYHKTGIKPEWEHEVERLKSDLEQLRPNIVVALGPDVL